MSITWEVQTEMRVSACAAYNPIRCRPFALKDVLPGSDNTNNSTALDRNAKRISRDFSPNVWHSVFPAAFHLSTPIIEITQILAFVLPWVRGQRKTVQGLGKRASIDGSDQRPASVCLLPFY